MEGLADPWVIVFHSAFTFWLDDTGVHKPMRSWKQSVQLCKPPTKCQIAINYSQGRRRERDRTSCLNLFLFSTYVQLLFLSCLKTFSWEKHMSIKKNTIKLIMEFYRVHFFYSKTSFFKVVATKGGLLILHKNIFICWESWLRIKAKYPPWTKYYIQPTTGWIYIYDLPTNLYKFLLLMQQVKGDR